MKYLVFIALIGILASCSPVKKGLLNDSQAPVFEIAVRQVKDGQKDDFVSRRAAFITKLKAQEGVSTDR